MNAGVWTSLARITFSRPVSSTKRATISQPLRWAELAPWWNGTASVTRVKGPWRGRRRAHGAQGSAVTDVLTTRHALLIRTQLAPQSVTLLEVRHKFVNVVRQITSPLAAVWTSINYVSFLWWSHSVKIAANELRNNVWNGETVHPVVTRW